MDDETIPANAEDHRDREHQRRNERQRELLRLHYRRYEHRSQVDALLRRYRAADSPEEEQTGER